MQLTRYRKPKALRVMLFLTLLVGTFASNAKNDDVSKDSNNLLQQLDKIQKQHSIPAYAVVITSPNQILVDQVRGVTKAGSKTPISTQAYFRIGSITKTFVSLGALAAQKQGKLKLSDKVTQYLDTHLLTNPYDKGNNNLSVTIEQLLEHSAGLTDMGRKEFTSNDDVTLSEGLKRFAKGRQLKWQPGLLYSYSNTGYGLAGRALEIATDKTINDWLTQSVFKPLAINSATMKRSETVIKHLVPGYQKDGVTPIPYWHMIYPSLGAINLQPRDMAKLLQYFLNRDKYNKTALKHQQINRQETPKTTLAAKQGLTYGYGLGLYQWFNQGHLFYGHGGDADGYLSRFGYQRNAQRGYFFVINTFNNRAKNQMQAAIEAYLVNNLPITVHTPEERKTDLSAFAGKYYQTGSRFSRQKSRPSLRLKWSNGQLHINQSGQSWDPLVHTGNHLFRRTFEPAPTTAIFIADGQYWFQGDEGNFTKHPAQ